MPTAQNLIDRAARLIGAVASGESLTATESADGLTALNSMLESWQTEKLVVYAYVDTAFTLVSGDASYTVGPSGDFALTPRPTKLEQVFVRASNIDYQVELVDKQKWYEIADKTSDSDIPIYAYYEPTLTNGTLQLWPVPNSANSLHIITCTTVSTLASLSTSLSLPQGYERAITYNLALEMAPEFGRDAPQTVAAIANESKGALKRMNNRPMLARPDLTQLVGVQRSNIYSGGYIP